MRRTVAFTIGVLLLLLADVAAREPASGIAGIYAAIGTNGDGSPYRAIVIIREHEDVFRVQWLFPSRRAVAGLGILDGDMLAVSYFGSPPGIVLYQVEDDRLVGHWTLIGGGGHVAAETLMRLREHSVTEPSARPQRFPVLRV